MLYSDIIVTLLSLMNNCDKLHLIISNKEMYNTYKQYLDPTENDHSPLVWAFKKERYDLAENLLKDPRIDYTVRDYEIFRISLEYAICGRIQLLKILLKDQRVDPNIEFNYKSKTYNLLIHAVDYCKKSLVSLILENNRLKPKVCNKALIKTCYISCECHGPDIVKLLLKDPRVDPAASDNRAIINVSEHNNHEILRILLLDPRVDPSAGDNIVIKNIYGCCEPFPDCKEEKQCTLAIKYLLDNPRVASTISDNFRQKCLKLL